MYHQEKINEHKYNMKQIWKFIKQTIDKENNKSSVPNSFNINGGRDKKIKSKYC